MQGKPKITVPVLGLNKDNSVLKKPEGTYTFALNAVNEGIDGQQGTISNEPSNEQCYSVPIGYQIMGHVTVNANTTIVFSTNGTSSEIGKVSNCNYVTLVNEECLAFSDMHPIKGVARVKNGCDTIVYFHDNFNEDRHINIDDIKSYYNEDGTIFYCNKLSLTPSFSIPSLTITEIDDNGSNGIKVGSYRFAIAYGSNNQRLTNYINISDLSRIYESSYNSSIFNIEGSAPDVVTNKAIKLNISDLDTSFDQLIISVVIYDTGDGITSSAYQIENLPITSDTLEYIYKGFDFNDDSLELVEDILVDRVNYTKSAAMLQLDNRLIRANLSNENIDWGSFQQNANLIETKYIVQTANIFDAKDNHSSTKWNYSQDFQSYMGDEIYAYGIVWEFDNGTESPVFHIPGRIKNDPRINVAASTASDINTNYQRVQATTNWDSDSFILDATTVKNVDHLGYSIGDSIERWQLTNTAIRDLDGIRNSLTTDETIIQSGYMAYHENDATYPEILGCDNKPIYPHVENPDGSFTMSKVRHHRFPDRDYVPLVANTLGNPPSTSLNPEQTTVYHLGVNFDNINPPATYADRVVGYRIVRGVRDENNRTVLEKGLMFSAMSYEVDNELHFSQPSRLNAIYDYKDNNANNDSYVPIQGGNAEDVFKCKDYTTTNAVLASKVCVVHTAKSKFNKGISGNPTSLKFENKYKGLVISNSTNVAGNPDHLHISGLYIDSDRYMDAANTPHSTKVVDLRYMGFNSRGSINNNTSATFSTVDNSSQQACIFVSVENSVNYNDTGTETVGDEVIATYVALKNENNRVWNNVSSIKYVRTTQAKYTGTSTDVYGGDIFISPMGDRYTMNGISCRSFVGISTSKRALIRNIYMYITESEIDTNLRHSNTTECGSYFPLQAYTSSAPIYDNAIEDEEYQSYSIYSLFGISDIYWHAFKEYGYLDVDNLPRPLCPNNYSYNKDYSLNNGFKLYFGLNDSYECSNCNELFTNRLVWSQVDNGQSLSDNYLINLANDYIEVTTNSGPITNIFSQRTRELYVQTESSLFKLFPSNQQLQTSDDVVELGTGQFMGTPPLELSTIPFGYAGNKERFNLINTEFGVFWVDQSNLRIYKLSENLEPISEHGMSSWFEENMDFEIDKLYNQYTDKPYPLRGNPFKRFSVGYSSVYDPKLERILFTKKDYDIDYNLLIQSPTESFTEAVINGPSCTTTNYVGDDYDFTVTKTLTNSSPNSIISPGAPYTVLTHNILNTSTYSIRLQGIVTETTTADIRLYVEVNGVIVLTTSFITANELDGNLVIDLNVGDVVKVKTFSNNATSYELNQTVLKVTDDKYLPPLTVANLSDVKYKGWTISYSIRNNTWTSFHSYIPAYIYNDGKFMYSSKFGNVVYKHHSTNCGTFYGRKYPHMVEFVIADINTFYPESLKLVSKMWNWDNVNNNWYENELETYNYLWVRSSNLSTGNKTIVTQLENDYITINNNTDVIAVKKYEEWNLSKIRNNTIDGSIGLSLTTNVGVDYDSYFFNDGQGYIDKVPNTNTIDVNKSLYSKDYIVDKYCYVRLGLTSDTNSRITLDLVATKKILKRNE